MHYLLPLERKAGHHNLIKTDTSETAAWNIYISTVLPLEAATFAPPWVTGALAHGWSRRQSALGSPLPLPLQAGRGLLPCVRPNIDPKNAHQSVWEKATCPYPSHLKMKLSESHHDLKYVGTQMDLISCV